MKQIKLFLAWLDWSTYARTSADSWKCNYQFPKSLCNLAWRTLFSLIALPITWFTHLWNRLFVSMEAFRNENSKPHKLSVWTTAIFTFFCLVLGVSVHDLTDGKKGFGWDLFHMSDPPILNYLKLIGYGIIGTIILIVIVVIVTWIIFYTFLAFKTLFYKNNSSESNSAVVKVIKAVKNKYCPTIDWSSIKRN